MRSQNRNERSHAHARGVMALAPLAPLAWVAALCAALVPAAAGAQAVVTAAQAARTAGVAPPPPDIAMLPANDAPAVAPAHAVTLAEYLDLVRRGSLSLRADQVRVQAARADLRAASAFPNPSVSYSRKRGEREAGIEQPLPIFGQRGLRMEGAQLGIAAAAAQADVAYADAARDAAREFIALLVAQERHARREAANRDLDAAAAIVRGQVQAGARSRYDLARIEVQQAQSAMEVAKSQAALDESAAKVAAAAALPQWQPRAVGSLQPAPQSTDFDALWAVAQQRLPAVRAAVAEQEHADKLVAVERREALPTPSLSLGRLRNDDGRSNVIGVSLEIPLFDRREGAIAKAVAEREEAQLRREAALSAAQSELRRATGQLAQRRQLSERYARQGLERLGDLQRMARDAYQLGQGSVLELIDSIESVAEKQIGYLDLVEEVLQAELDVRSAAGDLTGRLLY